MALKRFIELDAIVMAKIDNNVSVEAGALISSSWVEFFSSMSLNQ